jgi:hypothetical protein
VFETLSDTGAQALGGDLFAKLKPMVSESRSAWYRGMVTSFSNPDFGLSEACVPQFENCDPHIDNNFSMFLMYALAGAFGSQILLVLLWRLITSRKRWKRYQDKVQRVHHRLRAMQKHNEKVGGHQHFELRPVSRKRAHEIYKANQNRQHREEAVEMQQKKEQLCV